MISTLWSTLTRKLFLVSQSGRRQMVEQRIGVIINMTSEAGVQGSPGAEAAIPQRKPPLTPSFSWAKGLGKIIETNKLYECQIKK